MPASNPSDDLPPAWLVVSTARNGPLVYEAGWRHRDAGRALRTMKRRLGPAWLERAADGTSTRRRGRGRPGFLDESAAIVAKDRVVRAVERELAERADAAEREASAPPTFRAIAQDAEIVRIAAYTGLRRGELVALRWRDVDVTRHKIVVQCAINADVEAASTKSRRARDVPLPDQAAGALDRLSQRRDFTSPDDFVFVNRLRPPPRRVRATSPRRACPRSCWVAPAALPRPPPHLRLAPCRRRGRPRFGEGGDGPLADHDGRALPARALGERDGRQVHSCARARARAAQACYGYCELGLIPHACMVV